MHSVGRSSEPGDPVRGAVAQADPMVTSPQAGNGARAQMAAGAPRSVAPIAIARPASASLSLDDPPGRRPVGVQGRPAVERADGRLDTLLDILAEGSGRNP